MPSITFLWPWKAVNSMSCSACLVPGLSESLILVNQVVVASAGEVWVVTEVALEEVALEEVEDVGLELEKEVGVEVGLEMLVGGFPS